MFILNGKTKSCFKCAAINHQKRRYIEELKETLKAKDSEIFKLKNDLDNLRIENEELESKNHELKKAIETQNDSFAKLELKVEDLEDKEFMP